MHGQRRSRTAARLATGLGVAATMTLAGAVPATAAPTERDGAPPGLAEQEGRDRHGHRPPKGDDGERRGHRPPKGDDGERRGHGHRPPKDDDRGRGKHGHRPPGWAKKDSLRAVAPDDLAVGVAVAGGGHHEDMDYPDPFPNDRKYRRVLAREFSSLTPENQLKWEFVHPAPGEYNLEPAEDIVEFAERHGQDVRGHTLLWHSQNPEWLEEGDFTAEELRELLRDHIHTVVGHYAGQIDQWDVANEIFDEAGNLRTEENIWLRELGPGIIADAFRWAHEADPDAELFFNDYGVEGVNAKSDAYYELIQDLLADGVPVHGFSTQGHLSTQYGFPGDLEENLQRFDDLGLGTAITELDVRMVVGEEGPTDAQLEQQAEYYDQALEACLAVDGCDSFTVWGATDRYSWVPVFFPEEGAATIMWEDFERKPAYDALQETLAEAHPGKWYGKHPAYRHGR